MRKWLTFFLSLALGVLSLVVTPQGWAQTESSSDKVQQQAPGQKIAPAQKKTTPTLTVYSSRNEELLLPVLELFHKTTQIKVQHHNAPAGMLMEKIKAERGEKAADVLITVDAGNLWAAQQAGLLRPLKSAVLEKQVPAAYRDPGGHWWGVSLRLRTLFYNPTLTQADALSTYADLADPKWRGKLCLRTSKKVYNQSLVAMLLWHHGAQKAGRIVEGWVANLATHVFSSDTKLIEAVAAGQCAVGIANSYYYGRLLRTQPKIAARIFWANQKTTGVHANVSGVAVLKHAPHPQEAQQFAEFLLSREAQQLFASLNLEYPISPVVPQDPLLVPWGKFRMATMPLVEAGKKQRDAIQLMDRAKYR